MPIQWGILQNTQPDPAKYAIPIVMQSMQNDFNAKLEAKKLAELRAVKKQELDQEAEKAKQKRIDAANKLKQDAFNSRLEFMRDQYTSAIESGDKATAQNIGNRLYAMTGNPPPHAKTIPGGPTLPDGTPLWNIQMPQPKVDMSNQTDVLRLAAGGNPTALKMLDLQRQQKEKIAAAGAANTQVNVLNEMQKAGLTELQKSMSKNQADALEGIMEQGRLAGEQRNSLQSQRALIDQGLRTGAAQPLMTAVSGVVKDVFGVPPDKLAFLPDPAKGEAFNAASFKMLLDTLAKQKGPQTEGDADRAMKTFASLGKTPEANMFILDYLTALADRQEQMSDYISGKVFDEYRNDPNSVYKAEKEFRTWARKHPIVAKSPNSGMPVTYSAFVKNAQSKGQFTKEQIDELWREFSGAK